MRKLSDPREIYPTVFKNTPFEDSWGNIILNLPNIRDGNGRLVMPHEYRSTLKNDSIVMVNVYLKL